MPSSSKKKHESIFSKIKQCKNLYIMALPAVVFAFIFSYMPIWGMMTAFYDYNPGLGFSGSEFVGFKHFARFFADSSFWLVIRNSFAISLLNLVWHTIFPIGFAILLNEVVSLKFKKIVQTISYLPHFLSYVVIANIAITVLSPSGPVNNMLMGLRIVKEPLIFFTIPKAFWWLVSGINIWKEMGWAAIIYIAAISAIDPALYEAALVDGAGRLRRIWHITIAGIKPTIVVLLILAIPDLLNAGFDASFLLGNSMVADYSEVLDTYVYRVGLQMGQYSYAAAIGICRQIVALILILSANAYAKRISDYGLF